LNGAEHEILNETNAIRERFWAAFDAFMTPENKSQT
jgi:alpha-beta hydrolase superfamily lysophospholipase